MKKQVFFIASLFSSVAAMAQTNSVGIGTATPNASAILDITSTSKGVLLPRVSLGTVTDGTAVITPATGLLVYNTNAAMPAGVGIFYNSGTPATPLWARLPNVAGNSAPVIGQTIIWNGTTYVTGYPAVAVTPGTPLTGNGTATTPLTVNNKLPVYNADSLQGTKISSTAPANNQVLLYNAATSQYIPSAVPGDNWGTQVAITTGNAISGNGTSASPLAVNNTAALFNASNIQGTAVNATAPTTSGQVLIYNATTNQYAPGTVAGDNWGTQTAVTSGAVTGNGTAASPITINNKLAIYNADSLQGVKISATAPTNNQVLLYNSTTSQYVPSAVPGDNWGTQVAVTSGSAISGNGTTASPLSVNNTTALFNANSIQGAGVSQTAPTVGQVLVFNGSTYVPTSLSVSTSGQALTGNGVSSPLMVNTALPIYNADSLQGVKISSTAPGNGQVLIYNSTSNQYVPAAIPGDNWGTQVAAVTGAVTGNGTAASPLGVNTKLPIYNADSLQGIKISSTAPANNQVLVYNSSTGQYAPAAAPGDNWGTQVAVTSGNAISGNGTSASPLAVNNAAALFNANSIQGTTVSATAPTTSGQVLIYNATTNQYAPGTQTIVTSGAVTGNGTVASPITVNNKLAIYNADSLQGVKISATAPTNNQVLLYNSATGQYQPSAVPGDNWGTQSAVTSGAAISGNGLAATPLVVNNTLAIFNADSLRGTKIGTAAPANGQVLVYNSVNNDYEPGTQAITTSGAAITGNGTSASPITINNKLAIYNADSLQGVKVSTTAPTSGQVLSYVNGAYTPATIIDSTTASNGLNESGNDVELGGTLTKNTDIPLNSKNLTFSGTGYVGIGTAAAGATNTLDVKATADPVRLEGLQAVSPTVNYKPVVADPTGVLKTVATLTKMIAATASDTQAIAASSFNGGTAATLSFTSSNIMANIGGIFSFNDATNEFTVTEAGTYIIEGWCGYVSNIDASNGANNNISYGWGQGVNLDIDKNGTIMDGTRYIYTSEMGHISDIDFIATIYAKTILTLVAGDKITLALQKVLGSNSSAPNIIHPTGLPVSKKVVITRL